MFNLPQQKPVCKDRAKTFNDILFKSQTIWTSSRAGLYPVVRGKTSHF